jgi:hypothetical protein
MRRGGEQCIGEVVITGTDPLVDGGVVAAIRSG